MSDSRKQFEAEMTRKIRSLEALFKAFAREPNGNYLRDDIQSMWAGWQMHERYAAENQATAQETEALRLPAVNEGTPGMANSRLTFTHWSKDPLIPYSGCHCNTCEDARKGVFHPEWAGNTTPNTGASNA